MIRAATASAALFAAAAKSAFVAAVSPPAPAPIDGTPLADPGGGRVDDAMNDAPSACAFKLAGGGHALYDVLSGVGLAPPR